MSESGEPEEIQIRTFSEDSPNFALVIDGEVADNFSLPSFPPGQTPPIIEKLVAIFKSSPTIVTTLDWVIPGSTWDGESFHPPAE